jgi:hypothetical protein
MRLTQITADDDDNGDNDDIGKGRIMTINILLNSTRP